MEASELTPRIKEITQNNGFDIVGITDCHLQPQDIDFFKLWIVSGYHGEMKYLENPKRVSIHEWYPEAKSILIGGLSYKGTALEELTDKRQARIASYATYKDYHKIIYKRLKKTLKDIALIEPKTQGKIFVDANPVLERAYARKAGIGWTGKNTMIIHKQLGSCFFISGIALNLELEKDHEVKNHCGTCKKCLEACPTQCLKPYQMEATRCLSYITIEKKTLDIEKTIEEKMDSWVFGCDVCQAVCPYNKKAMEATKAIKTKKEWQPIIPNTIDLKTILSWTEKDYKEYFKRTPVLRAKWPVFLRNARMLDKVKGSSPESNKT